MKTRLFRLEVTLPPGAITRTPPHFVDWYHTSTLEEAQAQADEDLRHYGMFDACTMVWSERNPITLRPV